MRRVALILIAISCMLMCTVHAETLEPYGLSYTYEVATYTNNIPPEISAVLSNSLFVDDDCIGGVMLKQKGNGFSMVEALMAVEHEGNSVLLGISNKVIPLAENFFPEGSTFTARLFPSDTAEHASIDAAFFIEYGNRSVGFNLGDFQLGVGMTMDANGNGWLIQTRPYDGLNVIPLKNGLMDIIHSHRYYADITTAAEYWTFDTYPCTDVEANAIVAASPLDASLYFVNGCNLRTKATSKSNSLGKLTSSIPAKPTGNVQAGSQLPWVEVSINNITAWVSKNYTTSSDNEMVYLMDSASRITPVGRINRELTVNGNTLEAGSLIYVLAESDDSLLVCVPDGEMKWRMGSGTVIQVDKSDVIWALTLLQLKYKKFD